MAIKARPFIRLSPWLVVIAIAFSLADLSVLLFERNFIAPVNPGLRKIAHVAGTAPPMGLYSLVIDQNIFSADGLIPQPIGTDSAGPSPSLEFVGAQLSRLPIVLMATVVRRERSLSLAVLITKDSPTAIIVKVGDRVSGIGSIEGIRRGKVYFISEVSRDLEYVQMQIEQGIPLGELGASIPGLQRQSATEFTIDRSAFDQQLRDIGSLLAQAKAVPNIGASGRMEGFRIEFVQRGGIFDLLGIQAGDIIREVDGEAIDSPAKAIALFNSLRGKSDRRTEIHIGLERNGRSESLTYNVY
jgi:general secretion pathway protein C